MEQCAARARHVHARVGYDQGPQVPDPRDPVWAPFLEAHEAWWDLVWAAAEARGDEASTMTPEFGPPPYQHTVPHTGEPVGDLFEICEWMTNRQRDRFAARRPS